VVPTGVARLADVPSAAEAERVFAWLAARVVRGPFDVKTTAAPHYRRANLPLAGSPPVTDAPKWDAPNDGLPHRVRDIFREHPTFRTPRDVGALKGKCGVCEVRHVCGGSRARAHAMTGDWLEANPLCAYRSPRCRDAVARGAVEDADRYLARRTPG
jgi:MoaA/NifB/PqqE/SkfB family radical SAM enzyme